MISSARQLADAFRQTYESNLLIQDVIVLIDTLVKDEEQSVRMVVMEQLPEIALFCHAVGQPLEYVIEEHILPHVITLLSDNFSQVRKVAQTGILGLAERGVISAQFIEDRVFPVILKLSELHTLEDNRPEIEVITFMCKMASLVGKGAIINSYLGRFCFDCEDTGFQVRRVCAMGMADIAPVVGTVLTEKALLPRFLTLCEDEIWGVRKSCAEIFTTIARVCSYHVRTKCLAQAYINLLEDQSRWVRITAFQSLGQLIATFLHEEGDNVDLVPNESEQNFMTEMRNYAQIAVAKRQQAILEANLRRAAESAKAAAEAELKIKEWEEGKEMPGGGDVLSSTKRVDPFEDDEEPWDLPCPSESGQPQYSWLLDRSFGPDQQGQYREQEDDDWGDVQMDTTENLTQVMDDPFESAWEDAPSQVPLVWDGGNEHVGKENEEDNDSTTSTLTSIASLVTPTEDPAPVATNDQPPPSTSSPSDLSVSADFVGKDRIHIHLGHQVEGGKTSPTPSDTSSGVSSTSTTGTETSSYNTFQYWRFPIPDLELDIDMKNGKATNVHVRAKVHDPTSHLTYSSELNVSIRMDEGTSPPGYKQIPHHGDFTFKVKGGKEMTGEEEKKNCSSTCESGSIDSSGENPVTVVLESSEVQSVESSSNTVGFVQDVHRSYYNLFSVSNAENNNGMGKVVEMKYQKAIEPREESYLDSFYSDALGSRNDNLPYIVKAHGPSGDRGRLLPSLKTVSNVEDQDVVPPKLLKHYLSMADVEGDGSPVENEIPAYCAYTFPAVVITLGSAHWPILRECFEKLAIMFQWKIRYTLGSCLHEIARVIGPELTERDLLPFYDAITKDIDEVRVGILAHMAKFTSILREQARLCILDTLDSFLRTDNKNNWRFRNELALQLQEMTDMYGPEEIFRHLCPIALELANDPIADVRRAALVVISRQVRRLNLVVNWGERAEGNLLKEFILKLVELFCHSGRWVQRQSFATLSGLLIQDNALEPIQFAQDILPHLISLCEDKVPNVRLTVAQTMSSHVMKMDYFADSSNPHNSILVDTMVKLQNDSDADVRFYSSQGLSVGTEEETSSPSSSPPFPSSPSVVVVVDSSVDNGESSDPPPSSE